MFEPKSRYVQQPCYEVPDNRGRRVKVVACPPVPAQKYRGLHKRMQGQRLDHLAAKYLDDPAGFWRICEQNDVMLAEALSEADEIQIPFKEF